MPISKTQFVLLKKAVEYSKNNPVFIWANFKNYADIKSFDLTFNSLLFKGFFEHEKAGKNQFANSFQLTKKVVKLNL
jgi:hypothetical protein